MPLSVLYEIGVGPALVSGPADATTSYGLSADPLKACFHRVCTALRVRVLAWLGSCSCSCDRPLRNVFLFEFGFREILSTPPNTFRDASKCRSLLPAVAGLTVGISVGVLRLGSTPGMVYFRVENAWRCSAKISR
jgi:hypothetical protein